MVTVIADKEELITPVHNGVHTASNDNERPFQYIKDYQEVNFHRTSSCKLLPEDFFEKAAQSSVSAGLVSTASQGQRVGGIQGTYFLQIDAFEASNTSSNNLSDQTDDNGCLLLTLTDGILTVKGCTTEPIPELNLNIRPGCKLLLTGVIPIKDGLLQLSSENTRFQYGSNTYPRPKSAYRGRGGGSYRVSYEGRRGGGNPNTRYENHSNETNFLKGPPPKTTLMDFMTSLKITNQDHTDNSKAKDRHETKRRNPECEGESTASHPESIDPTTNASEQVTVQQDGSNEQLDPEDDPTQSNYRERRNPLPPRLQRAQDERTRRNTVRYYDETSSLPANERNETAATTNQSSSSSSSYSRRGEQTSFLSNNSSTANPYTPHGNILTTGNASPQTHLAYFPTNTGPLIYNLAGISSPPFANPSSYPTEPLAFCYGAPYATASYLPAAMSNGYNGDSKVNVNRSSVDENESKSTSESQQDNNPEQEGKSQVSSSASSTDGKGNSVQTNSEQKESKPRPRWKVGDACLARWSEDREFYVATVIQIHPPTCTVLFRDYNNYDQVHFSDLKLLPRDQPYYPSMSSSSDLNALAASVYYPPRPAYYPSPIDGCIIMPEAPPFPFNSAGTLYMYPPPMPFVQRSTRYQSTRRQENGPTTPPANETTVNSASTPSKDSSTISIADQQQDDEDDDSSLLTEEIEPCSIADAPMILVKEDDEREGSPSNKPDQEQLTDETSAD